VLAAGGLLVLVAAAVVGVVLLSGGSSATTRRGPLLSIFQDDDHLLYSSSGVVEQTLDQLKALGVDELRVTVLWSQIAPAASSTTRPAGFNARDPAAYPEPSWAPYDRLILLARQRGLGVDLNLTAPGPLWAMASGAPNVKDATHFKPAPAAFGDFVAAVGARYDGRYTVHAGSIAVTLPRVSFWTVWNEPNQPGWLFPQWASVGGRRVMIAPELYRRYTQTAWSALAATGHTPSSDTILVGELAPLGDEASQDASPIPALRFVRALYCLDDNYQPLRGSAASDEGCPSDARTFQSSNPALFRLTGFGHHPYSFFRPPQASLSDPNWAPLADLGRLETALDRSLGAYGVHRKLPLYLDEYGYETNPPDPFRGVPLATQAAYLDIAQHMAAEDPRVRAMAQFLLYDAKPNPAAPAGSQAYWSTFQTGLRFAAGGAKPSLTAYALPLVVARPDVSGGAATAIWGMVRPAASGTRVSVAVQWRAGSGTFRTVATVRTSQQSGIVQDSVKLPSGAGQVRLRWRAPRGHVWVSRSVAVRTG
jgi:hypothetical protein